MFFQKLEVKRLVCAAPVPAQLSVGFSGKALVCQRGALLLGGPRAPPSPYLLWPVLFEEGGSCWGARGLGAAALPCFSGKSLRAQGAEGTVWSQCAERARTLCPHSPTP